MSDNSAPLTTDKPFFFLEEGSVEKGNGEVGLASRHFLRCVTAGGCQASSGLNTGSDHALAASRLVISFPTPRNRSPGSRPRTPADRTRVSSPVSAAISAKAWPGERSRARWSDAGSANRLAWRRASPGLEATSEHVVFH